MEELCSYACVYTNTVMNEDTEECACKEGYKWDGFDFMCKIDQGNWLCDGFLALITDSFLKGVISPLFFIANFTANFFDHGSLFNFYYWFFELRLFKGQKKWGDDLLFHGHWPQYHRHYHVSLLSSGWDQVVPWRNHHLKASGSQKLPNSDLEI